MKGNCPRQCFSISLGLGQGSYVPLDIQYEFAEYLIDVRSSPCLMLSNETLDTLCLLCLRCVA